MRLPPGWHKANIDGASRGAPGQSSCGCIFRNFRAFVRGSFAMSLGHQYLLYAEMMGFIIAIKIACVKRLFPLWLESNSETLVNIVKTRSFSVPWPIKTR